MNDTNGSTLQVVRQGPSAKADAKPPASGRTGVIGALSRSTPLGRLSRGVSLCAIGVLIAALALVAVATMPSLFGYHSYTIDGASMEPTLSIGDAAVTQQASPRSLEIGDIIVRRDTLGGQPVLHRIVDIVNTNGEVAFVTQGDQSQTPDLQPVIFAGPGDKVIYRVPYAGYILNFAESWPGRLVLIGLPLILLSAAFASDAQRAIRPARRSSDLPARPAEPPAPTAIPELRHLADQLNSWALRRFVLRHSEGDHSVRQCALHPPIAGMTTLQILEALKHETGLAATSQRMAETCAELEVPYAPGSAGAEEHYANRAA